MNPRYAQPVPERIGPPAQLTPITSIVGLAAALAGKADVSHTHAQSDVTGLVSALAGKAATSHTHAIADVSGLQTALDGKAPVASVALTFVKPTPSTSYVQWTAMPAGPAFFLSLLDHQSLHRVDLTGRTQIRMFCWLAGDNANAGTKLYVRWAAGPGNPPASTGSYTNLGSGSDELFADVTAYSTDFVSSPWLSLKSAVKNDGYLCLIGEGGNSIASPRFAYVGVEYR